MKKHLGTISVIIFISFFMFTSNSCNDTQKQECAEAYLKADSCYKEGGKLIDKNSFVEAFSKFIEVIELLEILPEDMSDDEISLVSKSYYQMSHIAKNVLANSAEIDMLKRALFYQDMIDDSNLYARVIVNLASAYTTFELNDTAQYYINLASHYIDTISDDLDNYYMFQIILSDLYYQKKQYDSCLYVERQVIKFKDRRGLDTKIDSVRLGVIMFHSPYYLKAKPYLLKILEVLDVNNAKFAPIMTLLAKIYERENNADSAAMFQKYAYSMADIERDRYNNSMLISNLYENTKAKRDNKLSALREHKSVQKRNIKIFVIALLVITVVTLAIVTISKKSNKEINKQKTIVGNALQQHIHTIYRNQKNNVYQSILKEFSAVYPDAYEKFQNAHPELTETEQAICLLSFFSFRRKEISIILNIQENTVSKYRNSIVKKIGTTEIEDIMKDYL